MKTIRLTLFCLLSAISVSTLAKSVTVINVSNTPLAIQYKEAYKNPHSPAILKNLSTMRLNTHSSRSVNLQPSRFRDSGIVIISIQNPITGEWESLPKSATQFKKQPGCWASSHSHNKIRLKLTPQAGGHGFITCNVQP